LNIKSRLLRVCLISASSSFVFVQSAHAEIPTKLEPIYSEAVLFYNGKDYNRSLALLDELLKQKPGVTEFLELKALVLKNSHDDKQSAQVYRDLIAAKTADHKPEKEIAPYRYELGLLAFRAGKVPEARTQFESAVKAGFNEAACHFFLGLMDFRANQLPSAEDHLRATSSSSVAELKPAADFYLGQIYARLGRSSSATQSYFSARNRSSDVLEDEKSDADAKKIAKQINDATNTALKPFDRSGYFGNVGFITGYDTNVLSVPSSVISIDPNGASGASSIKTTLQGGVGYSSSPLNRYQFVPSYRGSVNLNLSGNAKPGEFFTHIVSLYVTRNALARTSIGGKLEAVYTMQNSSSTDQRFHFGSYSLVIPFGPYLRHEISSNLIFNAELNLAPQNYFQDSDNAQNLKRSGLDRNVRLSLKNDRGDRFWNPTFSLIADSNGTSGTEFSSQGVTFELSDTVRPTQAMSLVLTADAGFPRYADRADGPRQDHLYSMDANTSYRLSPKYALSGDVQYIYNGSTVEALYQYTRFVVSVGASYTF
jgi:tetratricopeptide (TPR) repeat protein